MSEFTSKNVVTGLIRGAVTTVSLFVCLIGLAVGIFSKFLGAFIMLIGIGALVWSIVSSWQDKSRLRWLNIAVKAFFALVFIITLVAILMN